MVSETHWNQWFPSLTQLRQETISCHSMPYMEMFRDEQCVQSLPENLRVIETLLPAGRHKGVFVSQQNIPKGTRYGPFTGNIVSPEELTSHNSKNAWEVLNVFVFNSQTQYSFMVQFHMTP